MFTDTVVRRVAPCSLKRHGYLMQLLSLAKAKAHSAKRALIKTSLFMSKTTAVIHTSILTLTETLT